MTKPKPLNIRQENFCRAYVRLGSKSKAYCEAYSLNGEKATRASKYGSSLTRNPAVADRIRELQQRTHDHNINLGELIQNLAAMLRFDITDLYDDKGCLKNLKELPKETRRMIQHVDVSEVYTRSGRDRELVGFTKKVKTYSKTDAIEKLMKHLGGYEKDNRQSGPVQNIVMINLGEGQQEI